jgi:hypothetical protein
VHSDVGGGYRETGPSDLALEWMIKEAMAVEHPLIVDMSRLKLKPSYEDIQHDERADGVAPGPRAPGKAYETAMGRTCYMKNLFATALA